MDVHKLIRDADFAVESLEMDRALSLFTAASTILKGQIELKVPEANPLLLSRVLLKLGEVKVSLDNQGGAREDFSCALSLLKEDDDSLETHEIRAGLCLYLGQLSSEKEALEAVRKGIEELEACVRLRETLCEQNQDMETEEEGPSAEESLQETRRQLSAAFCTIAELFLTDLCFEENAEQQCEAAVVAAMKIKDSCDGDPLIDSLQCMASLRLSQGRGEEAAKYMLQAYSKMKRGCEELSALVGLKKDDCDDASTQAVELTDVDAANSLPDFDFRCQSAKLLMECATVLKAEKGDASIMPKQVVECSYASIQVLASLLAENDEVIEVWYLMGCAYAAASPPDLDAAAQYWGRASELLTKVKIGLEVGAGSEEEEEDQLEDVRIQIEEVHQRLKEIGHVTETEDGDVAMIC